MGASGAIEHNKGVGDHLLFVKEVQCLSCFYNDSIKCKTPFHGIINGV